MRPTTTSAELSSRLIVFAGMPRTGSTSLFHILGQHPAIFRPFRKEMGYFLFNHHKGERWYLNAYAASTPAQRCVDITPEYFFDPRAVERIYSFGPGVRVVLGVRDPASFAVSLHHEYGKRYVVPPLEQYLDRYAYPRGTASIEFELRSGVIRSMLALYRETFGNRLLLYDFASFASRPLAVLRSIEKFIGVEPFFTSQTFTNVVMNSSDRPTRRWSSALLSSEPLIDAVSRILPAPLLRRLAGAVYRGCGETRPVPPLPVPSSVHALFEEDRRYIDALFQGKAVINGAEPYRGEVSE